MRPLLMMLGDYRSLTLNVVNRLTSVTRLFPNSFNDKFCDQMMVSKVLSPHLFQNMLYHGNKSFQLYDAEIAFVKYVFF